METQALGRTGLKVSRLALGGLFVAKHAAEQAEANRVVKRALELGINYIDTAPSYGNSEEALGEAFKEIKQPFILSTKLGGRPDPFKPQDKAALRQSVETSLKLLNREVIDILMIHEPDRPGQWDWWTDWQTINGPVLELMAELKKEGKIKYTGLGGTTCYELSHIINSGKFDVVLTAFNYSLLWQEAKETAVPAARAQNMGVVVGSPLQQGALARKYDAVNDPSAYWLSPARKEQMKKLYALSDECGLTLPELCLRWVLSDPRVDTVLMGARSVKEVDENVASAEKGALPDDLVKKIDALYQLVPFRPAEEPWGLGWKISNPGCYKGPAGLR
ncbi:MAG: aldo/keto reductase [Spirochaetota bacterium]